MDLKTYSDAIIASWEPYITMSISKDEAQLTADDLRPITRVMYASALIPGGKHPPRPPAQGLKCKLTTVLSSISHGLSRIGT